jgi:ribosomal subunit interface protein
MKITINCLHIELTDAIEAHVIKRLKTIDKFVSKDDGSVTCNVELAKTTNHHHKGEIYKTEINLHTAGKNHRVENTQTDLYTSIDKARDMLEHEVKTHYGKKQAIWKRGAVKVKNLLRKS